MNIRLAHVLVDDYVSYVIDIECQTNNVSTCMTWGWTDPTWDCSIKTLGRSDYSILWKDGLSMHVTLWLWLSSSKDAAIL